MHRNFKWIPCLILLLILLCTGCSKVESAADNTGNTTTWKSSAGSTQAADSADASQHWDNTPKVLVPHADGTVKSGNASILIDLSNLSDGYLMTQYTGTADKVKFFLTTPDNIKYTYDLAPATTYSTLPLTGGNGTYTISVMEHVTDNLYSNLFEQTLSVTLDNEFSPFLYPNQYTWFTAKSATVSKASELTASCHDALDAIGTIYHYVITNISYDEAKAANVSSGYLPDIDQTLADGTGICFDYAALMTAMLRSQGIPTKLEIGYSGDVYHAWISAYVAEKGWIDSVIEFDGTNWSLIDPTLAASNDAKSVKKYIGDGTNYTVKYSR